MKFYIAIGNSLPWDDNPQYEIEVKNRREAVIIARGISQVHGGVTVRMTDTPGFCNNGAYITEAKAPVIRPKGGWVCTDSDNRQYRLDEGQDLWEATQFTFRRGDDIMTINLNDYSPETIDDVLSAYGYTQGNREPGNFYDLTGDLVSNDIIAECIFEHEIEEV